MLGQECSEDQSLRGRGIGEFPQHPQEGRMSNQKKSAYLGTLFAVVCLLFGSVRSADGQAVYGSLYGTVQDTSGAAVKGATVTVTDEQKGTVQSVQTNDSGDWTVGHLVPDSYAVKVEGPGFQAAEFKGITVHAD